MTSELKPCPFCGNKGDGPIEEALHISMCEHEWRDPSWSVQCDKCTATNGHFNSDEDAAAHWNTRAVTDVSELVRYDLVMLKIGKHRTERTRRIRRTPDGKYVRYNQVAAILAGHATLLQGGVK